MVWPWGSSPSVASAHTGSAVTTPPPTSSSPQPVAPVHPPNDALASSPEIVSHPPSSHDTPLTPVSFLSSLSPTIPMVSFSIGFASGLMTGASRASLVFMAENAHRRPDTVQGWYFYNKTKNYKVVLASVKSGLYTGARVTAWTSLWVVADAAALQTRLKLLNEMSRRPAAYAHLDGLVQWSGHWTDGLLAGQAVALLASLAYRVPPGRLLPIGTFAGAATGAMQDLRDYLVRAEEAKEVQQVQRE